MTTTTSTQTLIGQIRSLLAAKGGDASAPEVAREFEEICRATASRLAECKRLSDPQAAVSRAEEEPALIEICDTLARFDAADQWASYCEEHSLPVAPRIDSGASSWLVGLYKTWPGAPDYLRKKYRDAILQKNEGVALSVARRILKVSPSDKAAREETHRILRRHFREKLRDLDELVECGDQRAALELADQLDRLPFENLKKGKAWVTAVAWRDAQKRQGDERKSAALIAGLEAQCAAGDLENAKAAVAAARSLIKTHAFNLAEEPKGQLEKAAAWIVEEEARRKREAGAKEIVDRCAMELSKVESNWSILTGSPLAEIEGARRRLSNCWREVEKIGGGIGTEIAPRVRERIKQLDSTTTKIKRKRRRKRRTAIFAVAFVAFSVAYYFYAQWRGAWMVEEFASYKKVRTAIPFKKLVSSANTYRWPIARLAGIDSDLERARSWLDREYGHKDAVRAKIVALDKETAETFPRPIDNYWTETEEIEANIDAAAVDLRPQLIKALAPFKERWDAHVDAYVTAARERRALAVDEANKIVTGTPRLDLAARDDEKFARVNKAVTELEVAMQTVIPPAAPLDEVARKEASLGTQLSDLQKRMTSFREVLLATQRAASYNDFVSAMQRFRDGPFENTPERDAAISMMAVAKREPELIGDIFAPGNPRAWAAFENNRGKPDIFPKTVEEEERVILEALSTDEIMENLYWCRFQEVPSGKTFVRYSEGPTRLRDRQVGPTKIIERSGKFFDVGAFRYAKYELKNGKGARLLSEGESIETKLFHKIRPSERVMGASQQYYRTGLLDSLDDILAAGDAHPLFRGSLHLELGKVISARKDEWGTMFAPQLVPDLERVREITPPLTSRSDWLWPGKYSDRADALRQFYAARRGHSYALESRINRKLIDSALSAGFGLAGYVDIDGTLALRPAADSAPILYGSPKPGAPSKVLFRRSGEGAEAEAVDAAIFSNDANPGWTALDEVAPFTPLLFFKGVHEELLAAVAAEEGISVATVRALALPIFLTGQAPDPEEPAALEAPEEPEAVVEGTPATP